MRAGTPTDGCMTQTLQKFIKVQSNNAFYQRAGRNVGHSEIKCLLNKAGVRIRRAPIDRTLQNKVPKSLEGEIMHLSHYPPLAGHYGQRRMYSNMHSNYYWSGMAQDA